VVRLVLDTNILVAAQRSSRGASARLLEAARLGKFTMLSSAALFLEYEAVLTRDEHLAVAAAAAAEKINAIASTAEYFRKRGERADWAAFEQVFGLNRRGEEPPPRSGDEAD
jgi:predicted nucleic acid-binding protein